MSGIKKVNCQNCGKVLERSIDDKRTKHYCNQECRMKGLKSNFKEKRSVKKSPNKINSFKKLGKNCESCN